MADSINEQHRFAPHDVAGMFDVSVMTVRRWAEYHKAHLSESANPSPGKPRSFTWADVEQFRQIKTWRDEGLSVDAINTRLTNNVTEPITSTVTDNSAIALPTSPEGLQQAPAMLVVLNDLEKRIDAKIEVLHQARRFDAVGFIGIGIIIGIAFCTMLIALASLYGVP